MTCVNGSFMDEIERELREVQLQRERLALERELARKRLLTCVRKGPAALAKVTGEVAGRISSVLRFFGRRWRLVIFLVIVVSSVIGVIERQERVRQERYKTELALFVKNKCQHMPAPQNCSEHSLSFDQEQTCEAFQKEAKANKSICELSAASEFYRSHKE